MCCDWISCVRKRLTSSCTFVSLKDFLNFSTRCILARSVSSWPCSSWTRSPRSGSASRGSTSRDAICLWMSTACSLKISMFWLNLQKKIIFQEKTEVSLNNWLEQDKKSFGYFILVILNLTRVYSYIKEVSHRLLPSLSVRYREYWVKMIF